MTREAEHDAARLSPGGELPEFLGPALRHFCDLRDGTHGGVKSRHDKERLFERAVELLDPHARAVLAELNTGLLAGTGQVTFTGLIETADGPEATWRLSWPEQQAAQVQPVTLTAHFGSRFHHPHLRGGTVGEWPLNVFSAADAEAQVPVLRAIAVADLHNLVFQRDYRLIPAVTRSALG
jgi:hypothetical protein